MLALLAVAALAPLLYVPGYLLARALLGAGQSADLLERHYERVVAGALLNGWLALLLAELRVFSAWLHLLLLLAIAVICAVVGWRRGALGLPAALAGVDGRRSIFRSPPQGRATNDERPTARSEPVLRLTRRRETLGFAAVGLLFAVLVARPFEVVLGARDAGVYATSGFAIARTGGIAQDDALVRQIALDQQSSDPAVRAGAAQAETNFLGVQAASRFIATRLRFAGYLIHEGDLQRGRVVPQFFHLYPAWIGLLASLLGLRGGLLATSLLGFLGLWGVAMLGRRLAGPWVGLLGGLFLALNGVQVWFSRYSTSEACAQFLCFAALYGFAVMQDRGARHQGLGARDQEPGVSDQESEFGLDHIVDADASSLKPQASSLKSRAWFGGLIAGVAAGQLALTRIDFFVLVAPLLLYLAYTALMRRWTRAHWALAGGLGAMLLHAGLHVIFISRAYLLDTLYARLQDQSAILARVAYWLWTPALRQTFQDIPRAAPLREPLRIWVELGLLAALVVAFVLLRRYGRPQRWLEAAALRHRRGLAAACALLVALLGVYGYLIRPQILTPQTLAALPGCLAPAQLRAPSGTCLALQGYIGAPIADPEHPNPLAYLLDTLSTRLRPARLPASAASIPARQAADLQETPTGGANLDHIKAAELVQLIGKDIHGLSFLVKDERDVTGWVISTTLALDSNVVAGLPIQSDNVVDKIVNPRTATAFSFGNPGESEKIGIAQANLVRVGWYLSPLGVVLGIAGFALWCWRGLNRASWLFLVASLIGTIFFVRLSYATSDLTYIYILRRYVPLAYPALSLGMAYAIVSISDLRFWILDSWRGQSKIQNPKSKIGLAVAVGLSVVLLGFFAATNRSLYRHVEYRGALDQLAAIASRFGPGDVLLFRGEGRDTPDLVATPLEYGFGLNAFAVRSDNPGKYADQLADYARRWQSQGRQVYLVLGANGAVALPGLRPEPVAPLSLRLPEFQQLRDQKPSGTQEFAFDSIVYRLAPAGQGPVAGPPRVAVNDFAAQLGGFYRPEQIGGATVAWTDGGALLRLPWPSRSGETLTIDLAPGVTRPAALGPARVCLSILPEQSFALGDRPFVHEQCFALGAGMQGYRYAIDTAGQPAPPTGTFLLRIASDAWVPAEVDAAQNDRRRLGVQFGGVSSQ